jgi:hypothetical protein
VEADIRGAASSGVAALILALASAAAARAEPADALSAIFGPQTLHGLVEARAAVADGEKSWLDQGFGKASVSGDGSVLAFDQAALEWKPSFGFAVSGDVTVLAQPHLNPAVDLGEAYLKLKAPPTTSGLRLAGRLGVFYPPVSLENDGIAWTPPDMLSASALDSWIGEEVKVGGAEVTLQQRFGGHELEATASVFGWNDTSGTLLTFRGWALHDVRAGIFTAYKLPPLSPFARLFQPPKDYPFVELDRRPGYYGRLEWRPPAPVAVHVFFYDNGGNRTAIDEDHQWAWETRFFEAGARWEPREDVRVLAQMVNGETIMGYPMGGHRWFDMGFRSAYLLAQKRFGDDTVSGRIDAFDTRDRTFRTIDDNQENGWALTAAWRHRLASHIDLIVEAQQVDSKRNARRLVGENPKQAQSVLQTALRLSF